MTSHFDERYSESQLFYCLHVDPLLWSIEFFKWFLRDLKSCFWGNPMFSSWLTPGRPWSTSNWKLQSFAFRISGAGLDSFLSFKEWGIFKKYLFVYPLENWHVHCEGWIVKRKFHLPSINFECKSWEFSGGNLFLQPKNQVPPWYEVGSKTSWWIHFVLKEKRKLRSVTSSCHD